MFSGLNDMTLSAAVQMSRKFSVMNNANERCLLQITIVNFEDYNGKF
jgi:hypothetical protein